MRILVAVKGLMDGAKVVRFGAQISRSAGKRLTKLIVVEHERDRARGQDILARVGGGLEGLEVEAKVRVGHAAEQIVREAEEGRFSLVLVGESQERNLVARLLTGSTAIRVVEHAPCPVIVVKGKVAEVRRILLCDSGGATEPVLTRFTAQLAGMLGASEEVTVLHVMSQISAGPGVRGKQLRADAQELIDEHAPEGLLLERDVDLLEGMSIHAQAKVRHGLVVEEILEEAGSGDYDLVVIGAYRGEGWQRILLDDLAHKIIAQMDRPVLVVR